MPEGVGYGKKAVRETGMTLKELAEMKKMKKAKHRKPMMPMMERHG